MSLSGFIITSSKLETYILLRLISISIQRMLEYHNYKISKNTIEINKSLEVFQKPKFEKTNGWMILLLVCYNDII